MNPRMEEIKSDKIEENERRMKKKKTSTKVKKNE